MKIVLQRVKEAKVEIKGNVAGKIGKGILVFVGVEKGDSLEEVEYLADKVANLRIFPDDVKRMNLSLLDISGEALVVSQFTITSIIGKGRRPGFERAEAPVKAKELIETFERKLEEKGVKVEKGIFGEMMDVYLINDGPVTFILERRRN
ncbi:MAG: D-aminoacyl-tRNA deacylase [Acidobacteriota bacterium]